MVIEVTFKELMTVLIKAYKKGFEMDPNDKENLNGKAETAAKDIIMWLLPQDDYKPTQT
jgi:hypothetical protein